MKPTGSKKVVAIFNASTTNAATATGLIDTKGFDYAEIGVVLGTSNAVTNKPTVLKLSEADVTNATSFANVSGAVGGTDFVIPDSVTTGHQVAALFRVNTAKRKRYLRVSVSPVTTQVVHSEANLLMPEQSPDIAADAGASVLVQI